MATTLSAPKPDITTHAANGTSGGQGGALIRYLDGLAGKAPDTAAAAFYASLDQVATVSPKIAGAVVAELRDQRRNLKLIASENYSSLASQLAHGNLLTDKYAEGYPHHRPAFQTKKLLALDYYRGAPLPHGYRHNLSGQLFEVHSYAVDPATQRL